MLRIPVPRATEPRYDEFVLARRRKLGGLSDQTTWGQLRCQTQERDDAWVVLYPRICRRKLLKVWTTDGCAV